MPRVHRQQRSCCPGCLSPFSNKRCHARHLWRHLRQRRRLRCMGGLDQRTRSRIGSMLQRRRRGGPCHCKDRRGCNTRGRRGRRTRRRGRRSGRNEAQPARRGSCAPRRHRNACRGARTRWRGAFDEFVLLYHACEPLLQLVHVGGLALQRLPQTPLVVQVAGHDPQLCLHLLGDGLGLERRILLRPQRLLLLEHVLPQVRDLRAQPLLLGLLDVQAPQCHLEDVLGGHIRVCLRPLPQGLRLLGVRHDLGTQRAVQ
mmetsp:Transcript_66045/g.202270  ORF Transcript_66045/g.202270 Transcript_66045/m.202270 type:complete len:257 (-) Transcript_66045:22-792(-)